MLFFISSLCFFVAAITTHLLWCCFCRSKNLQVIPFLCISAGYLAAVIYISSKLCPAGIAIWNEPLVVSSIIIYVLLIPTYLIFYAATVIDSPSRTAIRSIKDRKGLTYAEILECVGANEFIQTRLNSLVDFKFIALQNNVYRLLPRGFRLGGLLALFKRVLGHNPGG